MNAIWPDNVQSHSTHYAV